MTVTPDDAKSCNLVRLRMRPNCSDKLWS